MLCAEFAILHSICFITLGVPFIVRFSPSHRSELRLTKSPRMTRAYIKANSAAYETS
jgi:hypothetical protein